jgi:hypothetical protein
MKQLAHFSCGADIPFCALRSRRRQEGLRYIGAPYYIIQLSYFRSRRKHVCFSMSKTTQESIGRE